MAISIIDQDMAAVFREHGAGPRIDTQNALEQQFEEQGFISTHVSEPSLLEQLFVNVRVHWCRPTARHPFVTLFTSGMSDRPQSTPPEHEDCRFAELMIHLPAVAPGIFSEIQIVHGDLELSRAFVPAKSGHDTLLRDWAVHWLLTIARYPHVAGTWLGPGHFVAADESGPQTNIGFTGFVLLEPLSMPWQLKGVGGRPISLHMLVPLYPEEIALKRKAGTKELVRRFAEQSFTEATLADPNRPNVARGKNGARRPWWPFGKKG